MTSTMIILYSLVFIIGLAVGSFLNALIWRLKESDDLMGRSMCPRCRAKLPWHDLIPLVSFFVLEGKCRFCRKSIAWQYPCVELATGLLFVAAFVLHLPLLVMLFPTAQSALIARDWLVIAVLLFLFVFDARFGLIPDSVTLPSIVVLGILNMLIPLSAATGLLSWLNIVGSMVFGSLFFLVQFVLTRGKGVGDGDIRFGALMGATVGWPGVWIALTLSYVIGAVVAAGLLLGKKKKLKSTIALGPFLSVGTLVVYVFYDALPFLSLLL